MSDTIMAEEVKPETKVAFMAKPYSRDDKIKQEEEELEQLLKAQRGETEEETEEVKAKEEEPTSAEEKTFKKRYGDLRRHTQEKEKEFQTQIDDLKRQLKAASEKEIKLPRSEKELEEWASEYPDVAAIVETIAIKKAKEQAAALEERIKKVDQLEYTAKKEKAEAELLRIHPDFAEIRDSDDFHTWAEEQPRWVQDALYENDDDAKSAARAIDLYKSDKGISKKKSSGKDAAKSVQTKTSRSKPQDDERSTYLRESEVQRMSAHEYEQHSEEIMEAIRSGKFVYDVSGSAR
tara:strand:- start:3014 stop:3889 length:876 start_codon:yes stop_codon:yes gene_type:complete